MVILHHFGGDLMAKKAIERDGYALLLDQWAPPIDAGEPIGCVSTSFTFDGAFFEEECLGRFLGLETNPEDYGAAYLIEREEKLAKLTCASMIVDQKHCRGEHNLRWDLLLARVPGGCQHAKISLLQWQNHIRCIIASANMTEMGHRQNLEIFGVLNWHRGGRAGMDLLIDVTTFIKSLTSFVGGDSQQTGPKKKLLTFLDEVLVRARALDLNPVSSFTDGVHLKPLFVVPGGKNLLDQVREQWPARLVETATVTSPFFDDPVMNNRPAERLWELMRQKGTALVHYNVPVQKEADGSFTLRAPRSLIETKPTRPAAQVEVSGVASHSLLANEKMAIRELHAKSLYIEESRYRGALIGSSNFTSKGYGFSPKCNVEANLFYVVDAERFPKTSKALDFVQVSSELIKEPEAARWQYLSDSADEESDGEPVLPAGFGSALYRQGERGAEVVFTFVGELPSGWKIVDERSQSTILSAEAFPAHTPTVTVAWRELRPPSGFRVVWEGAHGYAWLPVNVEEVAHLPPPEELKNLPLDLLIEILVSAAPLYQVFARFLKRTEKVNQHDGDHGALDPHSRVDTTSFLLQRTRRISKAFLSLRHNLEKPMFSTSSLNWRLSGPVGVTAVANAISQEAKSPIEKAFLLGELCLELLQVKPQPADGSLPEAVIKQGIIEVVEQLKKDIEGIDTHDIPKLDDYLTAIFQRSA